MDFRNLFPVGPRGTTLRFHGTRVLANISKENPQGIDAAAPFDPLWMYTSVVTSHNTNLMQIDPITIIFDFLWYITVRALFLHPVCHVMWTSGSLFDFSSSSWFKCWFLDPEPRPASSLLPRLEMSNLRPDHCQPARDAEGGRRGENLSWWDGDKEEWFHATTDDQCRTNLKCK